MWFFIESVFLEHKFWKKNYVWTKYTFEIIWKISGNPKLLTFVVQFDWKKICIKFFNCNLLYHSSSFLVLRNSLLTLTLTNRINQNKGTDLIYSTYEILPLVWIIVKPIWNKLMHSFECRGFEILFYMFPQLLNF